MESCDIRIDNTVARVTLRLRGPLNIIGSAQIANFLDCMNRVSAMDDVRAVVLEGESERAFVGGADIYEMATLDAPSAREFITGIHNCCAAIRALPTPVIAKVQGYCLGAGLELAGQLSTPSETLSPSRSLALSQAFPTPSPSESC